MQQLCTVFHQAMAIRVCEVAVTKIHEMHACTKREPVGGREGGCLRFDSVCQRRDSADTPVHIEQVHTVKT